MKQLDFAATVQGAGLLVWAFRIPPAATSLPQVVLLVLVPHLWLIVAAARSPLPRGAKVFAAMAELVVVAGVVQALRT